MVHSSFRQLYHLADLCMKQSNELVCHQAIRQKERLGSGCSQWISTSTRLRFAHRETSENRSGEAGNVKGTFLLLLLFSNNLELVGVILKRRKGRNFGFFIKLKANTTLSEEGGSILQKTKMMEKERKKRSRKYKGRRESRGRGEGRGRLATKSMERKRVFGKCQSNWRRFTPISDTSLGRATSC